MNNFDSTIVSLTILWIFLPIIIISILPKSYIDFARIIAFFGSVQHLILWISVLIGFDFSELNYQNQCYINWLIPSQIAEFSFGVDGFSLSLILLTTIIMPICIYASINIIKNVKEFLISLLLIEFFLIFSFYTTNVLFFFIFFESVLIPMFIMIGFWGARDRKIKAAYYFFFYTLFGSLFMLFGILYLSNLIGSLNYDILLNQQFSMQTHLLLFILFFYSICNKNSNVSISYLITRSTCWSTNNRFGYFSEFIVKIR